jgi:hypothetical protein
MWVVAVAVVFLALAIPRIDTQNSRQRSILGFSMHRAAVVVVLGVVDDHLPTLVGARGGPRGAQSP